MCGHTNNPNNLCAYACYVPWCAYTLYSCSPLPTPTPDTGTSCTFLSPTLEFKVIIIKDPSYHTATIQRTSVPLNSQLPFLLHYHLTSSRLHLTLILHLSSHGEGISLQTPRLVYLMLMWHKDGHNGRELEAPRPGHGALHIQYKHRVRKLLLQEYHSPGLSSLQLRDSWTRDRVFVCKSSQSTASSPCYCLLAVWTHEST